MATINNNYTFLQGSYLFSEIAKRTKVFKEKHPNSKLFHLGIGNTTQPLPGTIINGLVQAVKNLASKETYSGYGDEQGSLNLRNALVSWYKEIGVGLQAEEIFISDGAKPDLANILSIFGRDNIIALQDPVYPAYLDSAVIQGFSGEYKNGKYKKIVYLSCTEENNFFPEVPNGVVDIIYICSPNNPTGSVATKAQLKKFVNYARRHKAVIIFDAAYSAFIQDASLPRSIYEIPGAKKCAIEINSFSKYAGFTGVRLGWTIGPEDLVIEKTSTGEVRSIWNRRQATMFNGASNIAQAGGLAALTKQGQRECKKITDYYLKNAVFIKNCFISLGLFVAGGQNAPYVWVKTPGSMPSWNFFDKLLEETHVVSTPGVGFGLRGEGFIRLSGFGQRKTTLEAIKSIKKNLKL